MKWLSTFSLTLLLFIGSVSCQSTASDQGTYSDLAPTEFRQMMVDKPGQIIDVRTPGEVASGRIANSVNIDIHGADFEAGLADLDKEKPVFVYCAAGGRSGRAMKKMSELGFTEVYNLEGGMTAWVEQGLEVAK